MGLTKAERAKKEMAESGVAEEGMVWGLVHLPYSLSIPFLAFSLPHPRVESLFICQDTLKEMDGRHS